MPIVRKRLRIPTGDVTGMPVSATQGDTTTTVSSYDARNMAPAVITTSGIATGSLSVSTQYSQVYEVLQSIGPNGATTTAAYDTAARPVTETAATGAAVTYTYSLTAPQVTATVNGRWTKSYLDGLGRAVKVETGNGGTTAWPLFHVGFLISHRYIYTFPGRKQYS